MAQNTQMDRLLDEGERELVAASRYPDIGDLSDKDLGRLRSNLRDRRDRAQDIAKRQRREMRGKSAPAGARPAGDDTGTREKLSLLSSAVQRANKEATRRKRFAAKDTLKKNAEKALEMRRASLRQNRPPAGRTANRGMRAVPNQKAPDITDRMEVGRVSQFVKQGQARRDSR
ncbi:MAG: hypothetical protein ACK4N1_14615 [Pseudorhizobium sp.]